MPPFGNNPQFVQRLSGSDPVVLRVPGQVRANDEDDRARHQRAVRADGDRDHAPARRRRRWRGQHARGRLEPHRRPAFEAASFALDAVKRCAEIWKREVFCVGHGVWRSNRDGAKGVRVDEDAAETAEEGAGLEGM